MTMWQCPLEDGAGHHGGCSEVPDLGGEIMNHGARVVLLCIVLVTLAAVAQADLALTISKAKWESGDRILLVEGTAPRVRSLTVKDAVTGAVIGQPAGSRVGHWALRVADPPIVPCRVRAEANGATVERAVDNAPSNCSTSAGLTGLAIAGPDAVNESSSAAYTATASFSNGSTQNVTATAVWSEDSAFASVAGGVLSTGAVTGDQTVNLTASYTTGGVTRSASKAITIVDATAVQGSHAGRFTTFEGTRTCMTCHENETREAHASVHYQWQGDASEAVGLNSPIAGKLGGINDFCIYPDINWIGKLTNLDGAVVDGGCARCHAGLGAKPDPEPTQAQLENVDCLICHSRNYKRTVATVDGQLRFVPDAANMTVSVLQAAVDITLPSKDTCLNCHTRAGGGNNFKRGDLEEAHRTATASFDVHLASEANGGAGLECLDCHTTVAHKVAGRGSDMRERDLPDPLNCTKCHPSAPHDTTRLNQHAARVNCTVCHIPEFAKVAATDMFRDYSAPADASPVTRLYEPHMLMQGHVTPEYRFFNGTSAFYQFGDPAVPADNGRVLMSGPLGSINDPGAKIHAFKRHLAKQPIDPTSRRLLPLKIGIFFQTGDLAGAVAAGAAAVGWPYSGYEFADTERYLGIYHEVAPSDQALDCTSCHGGNRLDFDALGYTPKTVRNGMPLCSSCHGAKTADFTRVHKIHVTDKKYDCINCHEFSKAY